MHELTVDVIPPGGVIRTVGETVRDLLVVECGVVEVETPGEPPRWGTRGAVIGMAESLLGAPSPSSVTAIRHSRVARVPARAVWEQGGGATGAFALSQLTRVSTLAQARDEGLHTVPPDPLVIAVILESLDDVRATQLASLLEEAVAGIEGSRLVRLTNAAADASIPLADELAACEAGAATVVYLVTAATGARGAAVTAHADRVVLVQPLLASAPGSPARDVACDGTARRHTEVVYVESGAQSTAESTRRMRAPAHVKRTHLLPEPSAARLELLLAGIRSAARAHDTLRDFEVFAELTPAELAWVQRALRWDRVDGGNVLVRQGERSEALWLLRAGRLEVVRETSGRQQHLATLGPGSVVGEAALLAGVPQGESVRAVRDSTVARLEREHVLSLMERSVGFARVMARVIARDVATRSFGEGDPGVKRGRTISIIPLAEPGRVRAFAAQLAQAMGDAGSDTTVVDTARLDLALGAQASTTRRGDVGDAEIIAWLNRLEEQHETVLLVCGGEVDSWARRAVRQSDALLFVADATASPARRPVEGGLLAVPTVAAAPRGAGNDGATGDANGATAFAGACHLVLLQPAGISEARGTAAWLAERASHTHHHLREGAREDLDRLARRLTGRAVAIAFSGAASRAPAHFGAVRAMREHGLPVDAMAGSSSGAGVAALLACGWSYEATLSHALRIIKDGIPTLKQFQPPYTALTSGKEAGEVLQAVFGERQLEDQLIPVTITAVDIRRHRLALYRRGPIWKLLRASGSLPLLWPPVWHEEELLVDGAILNYLPMDVFGEEVAFGLTIGSNLEISSKPGEPAFAKSMRYGTSMSGWRYLWRRLTGKKKPRPPGIVEILYHAMAIPSFHQQAAMERLGERENVCILTPPLGNFGLFGADAEVGKQLERETHAYAREALAPVAARWRERSGRR
ncbi:MAG: cyclic nucleotide-binding and patatin-like phospholipase domain-containing protein [Gemmatimonadaceae bacterium]